MDEDERTELVSDLSDLAVYQALLEHRGVRGIVVDCGECEEPHYHDWALLRASLEQLLADGRMRPHEAGLRPEPRLLRQLGVLPGIRGRRHGQRVGPLTAGPVTFHLTCERLSM